MWLFHSRFASLVIFLFCACFEKGINAKHNTKDLSMPSHEIACDNEEVFGSESSIHFWKQKYYSDLTLYSTSYGSFCLHNKTSEFVIRQCNPTTGEWLPPASLVKCASIPQQQNKFCPEDLLELYASEGFICLKISDGKQDFNESFCYGSDTIIGEKEMEKSETMAILNYLSKRKNIERFWLPIRRAKYNKYYNPFVIRLPGSQWGEVFEIQDLFANDDCMSAKITTDSNDQLSFQREITNCSEALPNVCVYRKNFVAYSGCPQGFGALAHKPNECYGIEWEAGLFPYDLRSLSIAEYISKNNSLQHIFYSIDLDRDRYFLIGNFTDEKNIHYDIEMNSKEQLRIVPFGGRRHALSCEHLTNLNRKSVEMVLNYNPQFGGLTLTIYNRNYIWRFSDLENFGVKCFTNSESDSMQWKAVKIKMLWQNALETKTLFEVKQGKHDGYYWCEAHTIFDFSVVRTEINVVRQQKRGHTYAFLLDLLCVEINCKELFAGEMWKRLNKNAKKTLNEIKKANKKLKQFEDLEISNIRLMDIAAIHSNGTSLQTLIHASAYLKSTSVEQYSEQSSEEIDVNEAEFSAVTAIWIKIRDLLIELLAFSSSKESGIVRSTTYCFPELYFSPNKERNIWQLSKYGQASTTTRICLNKNGVPVIRQCLGDFLWGAFWEEYDHFENREPCSQPEKSDIITYELRDIDAKKLTKNAPSKAMKNVRQLLEHNLDNLIPADFYYISRIMHTTMKSILKDSNLKPKPNETFSVEVARVYNSLMEVNEDVIKSSTMLNSTNILLEAFERLIDNEAIQMQVNNSMRHNSAPPVSTNKNVDDIKILEYEDIGAQVKMAHNFAIFILDPYVANVTGVALFKNDGNAFDGDNTGQDTMQGSFTNENFRFITSDQAVDDLLYEENLLLATYVPRTLWNRLDEISTLANFTAKSFQSTRFVIKIYANDILFQERQNEKEFNDGEKKIVTGKVVSVSIPGHDKDLPEMLPLIFKAASKIEYNNVSESSCSYWNYDSWASDGLTFLGRSEVNNDLVLCGCSHLTPFAYLIGDVHKLSVDSDIVVLVKTHEKALDVISVLGCSLSLFGILGIFTTAVTFQSWRQKASSKVLLHLSGAISLQMILFCFVNTEENFQYLMEYNIVSSCIAIGALLHYSVLVQFSWMIIIGYLQFKRYVQVFGNTRPTRFFQKSTIIGWGVPLIPVGLVLLFDQSSYIPDSESTNTPAICYPSGLSLYFAVIFPITITIFANFVIFSIIIYNILRGPGGTLRHTEKGLALSQLRLSILLFFLLGFTWIFGLLATLRAGIIFSYLFCLTATLQGFVIFIYFVILDPKTRRMWRGVFINLCGLKENYDSSISVKETIQTLR